jgi:hypothetical protein
VNLNKLYYIHQYSRDKWEEEYKKKHYSMMDAIVDSVHEVSKRGSMPDDFTLLMSPEQIQAYRIALSGPAKIKTHKRVR